MDFFGILVSYCGKKGAEYEQRTLLNSFTTWRIFVE